MIAPPAPFNPAPQAATTTRRATLAALLMAGSGFAAWQVTPRQKLSKLKGPLDLETAIPKAFGDWKMETSAYTGVVNPQQTSLLNTLYSQVLSRTYVNRGGDHVMLSIAYGDDQRDGLALHYPEVCYPAQGFQLLSNHEDSLTVQGSKIPIRRLETKLGDQRYEPVTYWTMIGTQPTRGGVQKKITEIRYGIKGLIPDGLLFRVSSIDQGSEHAFALHEQFARDLLASNRSEVAARLAGIDR